jgi:hypothetical protein
VSDYPLIPVGKLLGDRKGGLERVVAHGFRLRSLAVALHKALPSSLAGHCHLVNVRGNHIILQVESPSWATRVRFCVPGILDALRREAGTELHSVDIRVRPPDAGRGSTAAVRARLSAEAAEILRTAASYTLDPALRGALQRLSRHADRGPPKKRP